MPHTDGYTAVEHTTKNQSVFRPIALLRIPPASLRHACPDPQTYLTDLGQRELDTPDLALASEAVLAAELELRVEAFLLIRPPGGLEGLPVCSRQVKGSDTKRRIIPHAGTGSGGKSRISDHA